LMGQLMEIAKTFEPWWIYFTRLWCIYIKLYKKRPTNLDSLGVYSFCKKKLILIFFNWFILFVPHIWSTIFF
jgi:hypothetical protein